MLAVTLIERVPASKIALLTLCCSLDPVADGVVLARVQHHPQGVLGEHAGHVLGAEQHADAVGKTGQQLVGLAQADAGHQ